MKLELIVIGIGYALFGACHGVTVDCSGSTPLTETYPNTKAVPVRKVGNVFGGGGVSICQSALYAHNKVRELHNTDALMYNDTLAKQSEAWAIQLAKEYGDGNLLGMYHSKRDVEGENLAFKLIENGSVRSIADATIDWYLQGHGCDYNFSTASGRDSCHITSFQQVLWQASTQVGCGIAKISFQAYAKHYTAFTTVCQYLPGKPVEIKITGSPCGMTDENIRLLVYTSNVKPLKPVSKRPIDYWELESENNGCFDKGNKENCIPENCDKWDHICLKTCELCTA